MSDIQSCVLVVYPVCTLFLNFYLELCFRLLFILLPLYEFAIWLIWNKGRAELITS